MQISSATNFNHCINVLALLNRKVWLIWGLNYVTKCQSIKKMENFKLFKKELKSLLLIHSFYPVDKFLQI